MLDYPTKRGIFVALSLFLWISVLTAGFLFIGPVWVQCQVGISFVILALLAAFSIGKNWD